MDSRLPPPRVRVQKAVNRVKNPRITLDIVKSNVHNQNMQNDHLEGWVNSAIDRGCKENSWFGKKCLKIFKVTIDHTQTNC